VTAACQGPDGLLWILANHHLDSYNESKVTNYTNDLIPGIEDHKLVEILIDDENIIWLRSKDNIPLYLDQNRKLHVLHFDGLSHGKILNFIQSENGRVDLLTKEGHFHFDVDDQQIDTIHLFAEAMYTHAAIQISNEANNRFLISADNKFILYDALKGQSIYKFDSIHTYGAAMINDHQIVASTNKNNELLLIDINKNSIIENLAATLSKKYPLSNSYYRRVKRIDNDHIAITSGYQGLLVMNVHDYSITKYIHDFANSSSISSDNTYFLFANKNGNVFVTSRTSGLNIFTNKRKNARHIRSFVDYNLHHVFEGHISQITRASSGHFWLNSSLGLIKYDLKNNTAESNVYKDVDGQIRKINCLLADENRIWLGIAHRGADVIDEDGKQIKSYQQNTSNSIKHNNVHTIAKGFDDKIWIGSSGGINKIDPHTLQHVIPSVSDPIHAMKSSVRKLQTLGEETFIATWSQESFVSSKNALTKIQIPEKYSTTAITYFAKDKFGRLYQGSDDGVFISTYDSLVNQYIFLEKILSGRILSIEIDEDGYLWIATEKTLFKFDPLSGKQKTFTAENGFTGGGFRMNGSYTAEDGLQYYGMNSGVCFFNPKELSKIELKLNPFITAIFEGSNRLFVTKDEHIKLSSKKNNIGIYYQNIDIWNDPDIRYEYSIARDIAEWQPTITNPILIQNIKPGPYTIRLRASVDGVEWVEASNDIMLQIAYPWWRSWWFYALVSVILMIIFRVAYKFYSRLRADKIEERKYDESLNFFSFSMHKYSDLESDFWAVILDCIHQLNIDASSIYLADEHKQSYRREAVKINSDKDKDYLNRPSQIPFNSGTIGLVASSGNPTIITDLTQEVMAPLSLSSRRSKITIPIHSNDRILGVIDCEHGAKNYFNERRLSFISAIATIIATKIETHDAEQERKNAEISLANNLNRVSELEMKSLRSQMNPHFMFNSLNSINNFIVKNDQENASDYLTNFAQLMRIILENSRQDWVPLESELKALRLYIGMEKLRFENLFIFEESISKEINLMKTLVPPMLIQPYIENAIWHGLLPKKSSQCKLGLAIENKDGRLTITVEDDGIGTKQSHQHKSNFNITKKSFGLKIISERLDMINEIYKLGAAVRVVDKSDIGDETGTKVILSMKIKTTDHEGNNN
jgi:ligand-binding sensor domain-containing protein